MAMSLWTGGTDPFAQMDSMMRSMMDPRFFGAPVAAPTWSPSAMMATPGTMPGWTSLSGGGYAMDIIEKDDGYDIVADAPGMNPEDITVECNQGVLTIRGQHKEVREEKDRRGRVHRSERVMRSFNRSFTLPQNAKEDDIQASLDRGVLHVMVPKVPEPEKPQPKRIAVKPSAAHHETVGGTSHVGVAGTTGTIQMPTGTEGGMGTDVPMGAGGATGGQA